mgnify:FL=1
MLVGVVTPAAMMLLVGSANGIWVVGAGDASRRHQVARAFRREGIVAIGPSGSIEDIEKEAARREQAAGHKLRLKEPGMLRRFRDEAKHGDIVILRGGQREIFDVGLIGPYGHDAGLGVASWDLGHVRSANWIGLEPNELRDLESHVAEAFWSGRFARLGHGQAVLAQEVRRLVADSNVKPPIDGPELTRVLGPDEFVSLVEEFATTDGIDHAQLVEAVEVAQSFGAGEGEYHRLEADSIAMVLVPLFMSLGIELSRIRVEVPIGWLGAKPGAPAKRVDLVIFKTADVSEPMLFVEVKRRWNGLDWARNQMDEYLDLTGHAQLPNLVTDGSEFELRNMTGPTTQEQAEPTLDASLQWLTESSATSLAGIADYLAVPRP